MRKRNQQGATLMIVLFITFFLATVVPAVLGLALTGAKVTGAAHRDREHTYLATSALDAAIQEGRTARWVGRFGLTCPTLTLTAGTSTATVTCVSQTGVNEVDREITYTVSVDGTVMGTSNVIFRDGAAPTGEPVVDVTTWK